MRKSPTFHHPVLWTAIAALLLLAAMPALAASTAGTAGTAATGTPAAAISPFVTLSTPSPAAAADSLDVGFLKGPPHVLRTCVCSCGFPCTSDADCGLGGVCGTGITCCALPPSTVGPLEALFGAGLSSSENDTCGN